MEGKRKHTRHKKSGKTFTRRLWNEEVGWKAKRIINSLGR